MKSNDEIVLELTDVIAGAIREHAHECDAYCNHTVLSPIPDLRVSETMHGVVTEFTADVDAFAEFLASVLVDWQMP